MEHNIEELKSIPSAKSRPFSGIPMSRKQDDPKSAKKQRPVSAIEEKAPQKLGRFA
jgi:hypothetical protein